MPLITQAARAFEMVARFGSIRRAAERINAAPSAVNRQILNLEAEFGTPLFERLPRGMRLTEAGEIVVNQIREWQSDNLRMRSRVDDLKGRSGGHVKIGVMECLAHDFLPRAFAELKKIYPDASLRTVVSGTAEIVRQLAASEIDLAVTFNMPRDTGLKIMHEVKMPLGAVMPKDHPLAKSAEVHPDELFDHPIVVADNSVTIGPVIGAMIERSRKPSVPLAATNSIAMLKTMVRRGAGISILTPIDIYGELLADELHFAPIAGTRMFELLSVTARDVKTLPPSATAMAAIIASALEDAVRKIEIDWSGDVTD
jgi:DNA-binding transcriptional LysR family regulator